ncbi:hypothetical protein [uncultured Methanobrevibacter sp.]|uniref:hypothetical protein n=1 Tax=uncultured Methanobrevibacter sp. TaxID=253161 RepID=UPI0025DE8578|nr:hypothetical protein [uncultured Methanobrevibacter sp.]
MIFIASDCVGARMYEQLNMQFNNPFCWSRLSYHDFIFLANNLNDIDFNKIDINLINDPAKDKNKNMVGLIRIDNKINVLYPHYIQNSKYSHPTKNNTDVYYNNITSYILEKYMSRLNRMNLNEDIYLILHHKIDRPGFDVTLNECKNFLRIKSKYTKILVTHERSLLSEQNNNTNIIIAKQDAETGAIAKKIINNISIIKQ